MSPLTTASIVGIPSKMSWSTTANLRLPSAEVWCACGFSGSENSPHEGRHFIAFLENLSVSSAQELYQRVSQYLAEIDEGTAFSVSMGYRTKTGVLLMTFGFGMIAFGRGDDEIRWLMDGSQEKMVLEGIIQPGDTLFFSTARFKDLKFPLQEYIHLPTNELSADLFPRVQGHLESGEIAVLFVREELPHGSTSQKKMLETETLSELQTPLTQPLSSYAESSSHLISPDRIRAGVEAAQVTEVSARVPHKKSIQWLQKFQDFHWQQLHLIRIAVVGVIVMAFVGGLVWYRSWNVQNEYATVVVPIEELATAVIQDPDKFSQRNKAESLIERIGATRLSYSANRRRLTELQVQVESIFNQVSGQKNIVNLPVFYDFRLVSPEFLATKVSRERNRAFFLDVSRNQVISLDLNTKQNETIPLQEVDQPSDITTFGTRLFFLTSREIISTTLNGADAKTAVGFDKNIVDPSNISSFGENVYVLDRGAQQIWRASATSEDSSPSGWVRSAAGIDFSAVSSMAINGSIWLGSTDGEVYKLALGTRENFQFVGLPEPFTSSLLVATNSEGEKLVVVEPAQERVVIFQKETGEYLQQITSEQIGAVTDVVVNEEENLVFLLAGSVVYRIEI